MSGERWALTRNSEAPTRRPAPARAWLITGFLLLTKLPALVVVQGCAHVSAPPGGPADTIPPILIAVEPDSLTVIRGFDGEVRFEFDESITERNVERSVTLYPLEGRPRIGRRSNQIRVRPRQRWVDDRIYHIVVDTIVEDLFGNRLERPIHYVFSTGEPIPSNRVQGQIFDRITGAPLPLGRIDMVLAADTLRYGADADTAGRFRLDALPVDAYFAIAYQDVNQNRRADAFDRSDTISVDLGALDTLSLTFNVFHHDTIGPRVSQVEPIDTLTVEVQLDGYLDPDVPLSAANVLIMALPDSTPIAVDTVLHDWEYRTYVERQRLEQQAAAAAARAAEAARDTVGEEGAPAPADTIARPPLREPPPDETAAALQEIEPLPARRILVITTAPIPPGDYLVIASDLLNLNGLRGGGADEFEQPAPEPEPTEEQPPERPPGGGGATESGGF